MDRHTQTPDIAGERFSPRPARRWSVAALGGLVPERRGQAASTARRSLQYGSFTDTAGLDSHRHNQLLTSHTTAAMYTGLTDIDQQGNIVPGIAESWEPNKELTAWIFRLRKGVLFHNGREVDAEAVKLNILRIKDPAIGCDWHRGAIETIESVEVLDKYTVRINTSVPYVSVPSNVMHYPTNLRRQTTLTRRQNTLSVPAHSSLCPGIAGTRPDWCALKTTGRPMPRATTSPTSTRLLANLRRELGPPDSLAHRPGASDRYHGLCGCRNASRRPTATNTPSGGHISAASLWPSTLTRGRFRTSSCAPPRRTPSTAMPSTTRCFTARAACSTSPTHPATPGTWRDRGLEYDPDKAKALLKQARAVGTPLKIVCNVTVAFNREIAQVIQELWNSVGFKVTVETLDTIPFLKARKRGAPLMV